MTRRSVSVAGAADQQGSALASKTAINPSSLFIE
jgi:hypothetical protein